MSSLVAEKGDTRLPPGGLYRTPLVIPFQLEASAYVYVMGQMLVVYDLGTGKSHIGMAVSCLALEDRQADLILLVCEKNKLWEWHKDFATFTRIPAVSVYHGPKREKVLAEGPAVLITTYETMRQDVCVFETSRRTRDGKLMEWLRGKRVLVVYDEMSKLGNRSSRLYRAHQHMLRQLRKSDPGLRVVGLTGTPVEKNIENAFNELRLIVPGAMPTVENFERMCVASREMIRPSEGKFGRIRWNQDGLRRFSDLCAPHIIRKRKTDPDVREQFPAVTEEFLRVEMHTDQRDIYRALEDLAWDSNGEYQEVPGLHMLMRQFAGHPEAVRLAAEHGSSAIARMAYETIGSELGRCSSAKTEELLECLGRVCHGQESKALVFTFFGQTVLKVLAREAEKAKHQVFVTEGSMSAKFQHETRERFLASPGGAVLFSSDAGARGVNLPGVSYIIEYEAALTHASRMQRFGRGSRIGQGVPLTCLTLVLENTMEARGGISNMLERGEQSDVLLKDVEAEGHMSAADRRLLFAMARKRKAT